MLSTSYMTVLMLASHCPEVDLQWTHKYVSLAAPSEICWHAKDIAMSPEVEKHNRVHTMIYDALMNLPIIYDV